MAKGGRGTLGVEFQRGFVGLFAQVAVTATEVAAQRWHVKQVDRTREGGRFCRRAHGLGATNISVVICLTKFFNDLAGYIVELSGFVLGNLVCLARTGGELVSLQHEHLAVGQL